MANVLAKIWLRMDSVFDRVQRVFNGNFWEVFERRFRELSGGSVVDLACGTGELRNHIHPSKYLGVDINSAYVRFAKRRFSDPNTRFMEADATECALSTHDTVFFVGSAHHFSSDQMAKLCRAVQRSRSRRFVIVDGYPVGPFSGVLSWLDATLGGGKYFRRTDEIRDIVAAYFLIDDMGTFTALRSSYPYPYVVAHGRKRVP